MTLGTKIKLLLEIRENNVKELAKFLRVSTSTVYRWIAGTSKPDYEQMLYISMFLKCNIVNLYGLDGNFESLLTAYDEGLIKGGLIKLYE